jgi:hypothetical protein
MVFYPGPAPKHDFCYGCAGPANKRANIRKNAATFANIFSEKNVLFIEISFK